MLRISGPFLWQKTPDCFRSASRETIGCILSGHQVGLYGLEKTGSILRVQDTQGAVEAHAAQPQDGPAVCLHLAALHTDGEKQLRDDADKIVNIIDG